MQMEYLALLDGIRKKITRAEIKIMAYEKLLKEAKIFIAEKNRKGQGGENGVPLELKIDGILPL